MSKTILKNAAIYIVNNDAIINLMCKLNMSKVKKINKALKDLISLKNFKYHHIKYI